MYANLNGLPSWDEVKQALREIASGALDSATRRAKEELLRQVSQRPEYKQLEREVAAERGRQVASQVGAGIQAHFPLIAIGALAFLLLRRR